MEQQKDLSKLDDLKSKAAEQESQMGSLDPGSKLGPKKSPGRPKGSTKKKESEEIKASPKEPEEPQVPTPVILKPILNVFSKGVIAPWVGDPRAAMTNEELEGASQALGMVVDKYLPNVLNKYGPEFMCIMVFGQYGLRCYAMKRVLAEDNKKSAEQMNQSAPPKQHFNDNNEVKMPNPVHLV